MVQLNPRARYTEPTDALLLLLQYSLLEVDEWEFSPKHQHASSPTSPSCLGVEMHTYRRRTDPVKPSSLLLMAALYRTRVFHASRKPRAINSECQIWRFTCLTTFRTHRNRSFWDRILARVCEERKKQKHSKTKRNYVNLKKLKGNRIKSSEFVCQ